MALCEICGSFLVANDAVERTQSHVTGKQHIGYGMVRDFIAEYKVILPFQSNLLLKLFLLVIISRNYFLFRRQRRKRGKKKD